MRRVWLGAIALLAACASNADPGADSTSVTPPRAPTSAVRPQEDQEPASASTTPEATSTPAPTTPVPATPAPTTVAPGTVAPTTVAPTTVAPTTTLAPTATTVTTTPYRIPVAREDGAGYGREHHDYPASDIFVGCGAEIVAPVNGRVTEIRRVDEWVADVDNPATRGGKSITIVGDDGVRYYLAHFDSIVDDLEPGARVAIGDLLGLMGRTGRAGACHVHFAISPPCPGKEWSVRRGVVWPWPYLDAWRAGEQRSPVDEVADWLAANPTACADAMADPNAADA